jgi:hypothetical protein
MATKQHYSNTWNLTKPQGDEGENRAGRAMLRAFPGVANYDIIATDLESQRRGDLLAVKYAGGVMAVEVKTDLLADRTGNVALELARRVGVGLVGTGLSTSAADLWAFVLTRRVVFAKPEPLRRLVDEKRAQGTLHEAYGGDGRRTLLALVPLSSVLGLAGVVVVVDAEGTR